MGKKKILVLGATGMAGHMVYNYLKETGRYEMHNLVFRTKLTDDSIVCDVRDQNDLLQVFRQVKPDIAINCIGALVKESKTNPDNAIYLNAYLPHFLKRLCDETGGRLIHISTDCVFSGERGNYAEDDFRDADDVYGRSKALGEIINEKDCTLRTSIIGPELKVNGSGLFHWFMQQKGQVNGYTKAIWSGVTTLELAKAIKKVIENDLSGLFHVTNGIPISKFNLLNLIREIWNRGDVEVIPYEKYYANKSLKKSSRFDFQVPSYSIMGKDLKSWANKHKGTF
jgi:dTDP-4-dehydrorhamnose reductase